MTTPNPVFVAVDTTDLDAARTLAERLRGCVGGLKLGLEFFAARGPAGVEAIADTGLPIFLDLKLHDIPNTVAGAVRAVLPLRPALLTVHASGGPAMIRAAADAAAGAGKSAPAIVAVTVLTSLDAADLAAVGQSPDPTAQALTLAEMASRSGADGVVCSPHEAAALRDALGPDATLVVPGVRPAGSAAQDQKRVMSPGEAMRAGATILVIGRPITQANDPREAAERIASELEGAAAR